MRFSVDFALIRSPAYRTQLRRQMNERDSAIRAILTDTLMSYETGVSYRRLA